tara:strand:+ start:503 stop:1027 length:525 start_codon:yes stop_codon:yes gene_type:complete
MAVTISGSSPTFSSGYAGGTITSGTAQASTSGTSIDFTGIPSWVKRVTVIFNNVRTNGGSNYVIQIGSGSVTTTGYASACSFSGASMSGTNTTSGFPMWRGSSGEIQTGLFTICLISGTTYIGSGVFGYSSAQSYSTQGGGLSPALSSALDRVRITTANGTDTFNLGSINILYE